MKKLTLHNISFTYGGQKNILKDFSLDITPGAITCLLGSSGCGKTTLLNIMGGLRQPAQGEMIGFNEEKIAYIFQETRILPWKTVIDNVVFPLLDKLPADEARTRAGLYLSNLGLKNELDLYPAQLSGGMKQRVAIARAFAYPSTLILMDEAFQGLDSILKNNILNSFLETWQDNQRTVIFVTHDIDEAILLGQEIIILGDQPLAIKKRIVREKQSSEMIKQVILESLTAAAF